MENLEPENALILPGENAFIPTNFEMNKKEVETPATKPDIVENSPLLRLWHKKDDTFWVPRANVWILLRSPLAYATPSNCVKTRLYADLLKDSLNEYAYDAEVAGLAYTIENQLEGMLVRNTRNKRGLNRKLNEFHSLLLEVIMISYLYY